MAKKKKTNGSLKVTKGRNKSLLGQNSIFTPEVIDDIHIKSQLGRYRMRGMALMRKIPTFDDLVFYQELLQDLISKVIEKNVKQKQSLVLVAKIQSS